MPKELVPAGLLAEADDPPADAGRNVDLQVLRLKPDQGTPSTVNDDEVKAIGLASPDVLYDELAVGPIVVPGLQESSADWD